MIVIAGAFEIEPDQRDEFLRERGELMARSRAEAGCLEYVFSADPLEKGRVVLLERWASQDDLDAHVVELRAHPRPPGVVPISTDVRIYDVSGDRPLGS
jgi:quinol monooxygenase YgiN